MGQAIKKGDLVALGLGHLTLARRSRELSGGERQRVRLASLLRADLAGTTLVLDEPSAGLAPNTAKEVFQDVVAVNELGTAILMVEQNARQGLSISDRGYVLDQGRVRFEDDAADLLENPEVGELYLGG